MREDTIDLRLLKLAFKYDPLTGLIKRIKRSKNCVVGEWFAGTLTTTGYLEVCFQGKQIRVHRVAWALYYGVWPSNQIDHYNRMRSDNRICNLRDVTRVINQQNQKLPRNNKTGYIGVCWIKSNNGYVARITVNKRVINLGTYTNLEDAAFARKQAELQYGFHPNHGRD